MKITVKDNLVIYEDIRLEDMDEYIKIQQEEFYKLNAQINAKKQLENMTNTEEGTAYCAPDNIETSDYINVLKLFDENKINKRNKKEIIFEGVKYESIKEAAEKTGLSSKTISRRLHKQ